MRAFVLTLGLLAAGGQAVAQQSRPAAAPQDTAALPPQEIGTIGVGQTRNGLLEAGDYTMSDGTWADIWYVQVSAGQRLVVEARGRGFNAYLQLLDPWGNKLSEDAGGAGSGGARITYAAREAGRFQVVVNNYSEVPQSGAYTLVVR
jgi:hypothetical protein